jgi:hypothetical protein
MYTYLYIYMYVYIYIYIYMYMYMYVYVCTVCIVCVHCIYQSPSFKVVPRAAQDLRRRTEITPVKDSHTRIKPLALANGHGRYITVTPERTLLSVGEWCWIKAGVP